MHRKETAPFTKNNSDHRLSPRRILAGTGDCTVATAEKIKHTTGCTVDAQKRNTVLVTDDGRELRGTLAKLWGTSVASMSGGWGWTESVPTILGAWICACQSDSDSDPFPRLLLSVRLRPGLNSDRG
eukprot:gene11207-biopygen22870